MTGGNFGLRPEELMITIVAKHDLGAKKPSSTLIKKVGKKVLDVFSNE